MDRRNGVDYDIHAQRITAAGVRAPGWPLDGVGVCVQPGDQGGVQGWLRVSALSDGLAGAFIAWHDPRDGDLDIYVQRITDHGDVAPGWPVNGRLVCDAQGSQVLPVLAADGTGGVFVVWTDNRDAPPSTTDTDVYAQRVTSQGSIAPGWPVNRVAVSTVMNSSWNVAVLADGSGGAFVAASELGSINLHRITSSGSVAPGWPADGVYVGPDGCRDGHVQLIPDGTGGVIATWEAGSCFIFTDTKVFVQRVTGDGLVAPGWPAGGVYIDLCWYQVFPRLVTDGVGGAIFTWDNSGPGVYAQRLTATGTQAPGWLPGPGVTLSTGGQAVSRPDLVSDGAGGAIVAWSDNWGIIRAQRVMSNGSTAAGWPTTVAVAENSREVSITTDSRGGAIVVWSDGRNGLPGVESDIYALRIGPDGQIPTDVEAGLGQWELGPAWPNPFAEELTVNLRLGVPAPVSVQVFDVSGRRVRTLWHQSALSGLQVLRWDGRGDRGAQLANGVYWLRVSSPTFGAFRKVVLLR